jgi:hypothetical protein
MQPARGAGHVNEEVRMGARRLFTGLGVALGVALFAIGVTAGGAPAQAQTYVKAGVLTCSVGPGVGLLITSSKSLDCAFTPDFRGPERYTGQIRKFGLDVGVTGDAVIVWGVLSTVEGFAPGGLAGTYGGVSAEASVVIGAGANVLVGGSNRAFALQPLSIQGQFGLNLAAGVTQIDLVHVPY